MKQIKLQVKKKIYFASDFHLGISASSNPSEREEKICEWLDFISKDAQLVYLVGDVFDVWFEYKRVVPKGFTRLFGKFHELRKKGIEIEIFTGNHDFWMSDYFQKEFDIPVHRDKIEVMINEKVFLIGHGDGLGPGDTGYKILKKILQNPICELLYKLLHPNIGIGLASWFSRRGPKHKEIIKEKYHGKENEWLVQYAKQKLNQHFFHYFIFGHRHLPISFTYLNGSKYINLGDWIYYFTYAYFDGEHCNLIPFEKSNTEIIYDSE